MASVILPAFSVGVKSPSFPSKIGQAWLQFYCLLAITSVKSVERPSRTGTSTTNNNIFGGRREIAIRNHFFRGKGAANLESGGRDNRFGEGQGEHTQHFFVVVRRVSLPPEGRMTFDESAAFRKRKMLSGSGRFSEEEEESLPEEDQLPHFRKRTKIDLFRNRIKSKLPPKM